MTIIIAIIMFSILILVHELGHFVAAKAFKVRVIEFSVGMGPALFQKQKGDTLYSFRPILFGGYCKLKGEDGNEEEFKEENQLVDKVEESNLDDSLENKNALQKIIILAAGSFMNVLLGVILVIIVLYNMGVPIPVVDTVLTDSPAYYAGIKENDELVEINGVEIDSWEAFVSEFKNVKKDETVDIIVNRDGNEKEIRTKVEENEDGRLIIGVAVKKEKNLADAIIKGPQASYNMLKVMYSSLGQLFQGEVSSKEIVGPVGIVNMVGNSMKVGFINFLYFAALISLNLAIINMLPFPGLDGGRILFVIIRVLSRGKLSGTAEAYIHAAGIILLLGLTCYVTFNDVFKLIGK